MRECSASRLTSTQLGTSALYAKLAVRCTDMLCYNLNSGLPSLQHSSPERLTLWKCLCVALQGETCNKLYDALPHHAATMYIS